MTAGVTLPPSYAEDILYAAYVDRLLIKSLGVQAGVVEAEDYKVSAGTGLQVNVKSGKAFVEETKAIEESSNTFYNGLYNVLNPTEQNPYNNVEVSAVNPQIAQIILRVYDVGELKIGGSTYGRIEWLNGTPNALATEAKMKEGIYEGRAALPQSSYRLVNILVPKNATKSSEYYIEDARRYTKTNLITGYHTSNAVAKIGEFFLSEGNITATLPKPFAGAEIGFANFEVGTTLTIKSSIEKTIEGNFPASPASEVKLLPAQSLIMRGSNNFSWLVIAGEPKYESVVGGQISRSLNTLYTPSETRPVLVNIIITPKEETGGQTTLYVNGIEKFPLTVPATTNAMTIFPFRSVAGQTWELRPFAGKVNVSSTYQNL